MPQPAYRRLYYLLPEEPPHFLATSKSKIFDQEGKLVDTIAGSKHRGLNRVTWSMALKRPLVASPPPKPPISGCHWSRVLPGMYTVKLTKGDQVYSAPLQIAIDPAPRITSQTARLNWISP